MAKILIAEISGKRPGDKHKRPTEKNETRYDHVIISNNSDGYVTDWPIVNVPDDYRDWYTSTVKCSDNAWYAPLNRSYAIKYAKEHGYDYLVQVDDNIVQMEIATYRSGARLRATHHLGDDMFDDFVGMLCTILDCTNAAMAGCQLKGIGEPTEEFLRERYCYSFFALKLSVCPPVFQGDFEDDIEYRLKLKQMGLPCVQCAPLRYSKTGQAKDRDLTGCRAEYAKQGLKRGEHMTKLYGDVYTCRMRDKANHARSQSAGENIYFKHYLKPFKVGVIVSDKTAIEDYMRYLFAKWGSKQPDKCIVKQKRVKIK